jgi:micrococcal nuclease
VEAGQVPVTLVDTVDGDTIKVRMNGKVETVRYLLVNTPESKKPGMCVQLYAKEAYIRNAELVKAGRVTLEFKKGETRDSYARISLCFCEWRLCSREAAPGGVRTSYLYHGSTL